MHLKWNTLNLIEAALTQFWLLINFVSSPKFEIASNHDIQSHSPSVSKFRQNCRQLKTLVDKVIPKGQSYQMNVKLLENRTNKSTELIFLIETCHLVLVCGTKVCQRGRILMGCPIF